MSSFKTVFAATFIGLVLGGAGVYAFLLAPDQKLTLRASLGETEAQTTLAENYFTGGDGFTVDAGKQRYWLERAAAKDMTAKTRLGLVLAFEDNEADVAQGRDLMMDALKTTPPELRKETMFMLALSYALVKPLNPQRAAGWYARAFSAGSQEAEAALYDMVGLQTQEDKTVAMGQVKTRLEAAKAKVEAEFYKQPQPSTSPSL